MADIREVAKAQHRILADLLDMANDEFSNHGCNDYELENTPENLAIVTAMEKWNTENSGEEPYAPNISNDGTKIYTQDWYLMSYFAHLAHIEAGDEK
jgi:hypothetical protein